MLGEKGVFFVEAMSSADARDGKVFRSFKASPVLMQGSSTVTGTTASKEFDVVNISSAAVSIGDLVLVVKTGQGFYVTVEGGGGGGTSTGSVIEFEILGESSSSSSEGSGDPGESMACSERAYDAPAFTRATVIARPCGVSRVPGEVDGAVTVHDTESGKFLEDREAGALAGKRGFAVRMTGEDLGSTSGSSGSSGDDEGCRWVIIWINWFRWLRVQTDTIYGEDEITNKYSNIKVWDECKLPDEVIQGADCYEQGSGSSS
jgi:hypothetical protein